MDHQLQYLADFRREFKTFFVFFRHNHLFMLYCVSAYMRYMVSKFIGVNTLGNMLHFRALFLALCFAFIAPFPAPALEDLKSELVYRTNLGRADDVKLLLQQGASANETNPEGVPLL